MFSALFQHGDEPFTIAHLFTDPTSVAQRMHASVLMLERAGKPQLLPGDDVALKPGDRLLVVGSDNARRLQQRYLDEPSTVQWVRSGSEPPRGLLFRWWRQRGMKQSG
jgi:hypothetical protein